MKSGERVLGSVYNFLLAVLGSLSILSAPLFTMFSFREILWITVVTLILNIVIALILTRVKRKTRVLGVLFAATAAAALLLYRVIYKGALAAYNRMVPHLNRDSNYNLHKINTGIKTESQVELFLVIFLIFMAVMVTLLINIEVYYIKNILAAGLIMAPVYGAMLFFNVVPTMGSFILSVLFLTGQWGAPLKTKKQRRNAMKYTGAYISLGMTVAVIVVVSLVYPESRYKRNKVFMELNSFINIKVQEKERSEKEDGFGITQNSSTNMGHLGYADEIHFNNEKIAMVTTYDTGATQYVRMNTYGKYSKNMWSPGAVTDDNISKYYTSTMYRRIDSNQELRDLFADNDEAYYSKLVQYNTTVYPGKTTEEYSVSGEFYVSPKYYSLFYNIRLKMDNAEQMKKNEEYIYHNYLEVPESVRKLLDSLVETHNISTYEEMAEYIEFVKKYLSDNCSYTLSPGSVPADREIVEYFLTDSNKGYCTYFATSGAMMLRYAGIPTRYCEGYVISTADMKKNGKSYTNGTVDRYKAGTPVNKLGFSNSEIEQYFTKRNLTYTNVAIYDNQAHAWAEVFLEGYGWIPVEFTPGYSSNSSGFIGEKEERPSDSYKNDENTESEETTDVTEENPDGEEDTEESIGGGISEVINTDSFKRIMTILLAIIPVGGVITFSGVRIYRRKRFLKGETEEGRSPQFMYKYILSCLETIGYKKMNETDYEEFAEYVSLAEKGIDGEGLNRATRIAIYYRFGNHEITKEDINEMSDIVYNTRRYCLKKLSLPKKFIFVFIKGL
ncbi:MAG: transglutaminase-like domain-containing protein [Eubacteriales bacterium]|nr:transglutaminase-like domain-containing protein [Eubacteriales bacterium]